MLDVLNVLNGVVLGSTMLANITLYSDADYEVQRTRELKDDDLLPEISTVMM